MRFAVLIALAGLATAGLAADGVEPASKPERYAAQTEAGEWRVAADYHFRSIPGARDGFMLRDVLVIEVAIYGDTGEEIDLSSSLFALQINKDRLLMPEAPGAVLYRDRYGHSPTLAAGGGIGNSGGVVVLGGPDHRPRFPGDPRNQRRRMPRVEQEPVARESHGPDPEELLREAALPSGRHDLPVAGMLYFHYPKKTKSIKRLELLFYYEAGETALLRLK